MNRTVLRHVWVLLFLPASLRADLQVVKDGTPPSRIRPQFVMISGDWMEHSPPSKRVNAPEFLDLLYPGQKLVLAILAEGADRDKILQGVGLSVAVKADSGRFHDEEALKPLGLRKIKAEGADLALITLRA